MDDLVGSYIGWWIPDSHWVIPRLMSYIGKVNESGLKLSVTTRTDKHNHTQYKFFFT